MINYSSKLRFVRCDAEGKSAPDGNLCKIVSYVDTAPDSHKTTICDESRPCRRQGSFVEFLDDASLFALLVDLSASYATGVSNREVLDAFVNEYCKERGNEVVGAVWLFQEPPGIAQFDLMRNDYCYALASDDGIRKAFSKVNQKNIPYNQAAHTLEDVLARASAEFGKDVPKTVVIPCEVEDSVTSALYDMGWIVMKREDGDYTFMG